MSETCLVTPKTPKKFNFGGLQLEGSNRKIFGGDTPRRVSERTEKNLKIWVKNRLDNVSHYLMCLCVSHTSKCV